VIARRVTFFGTRFLPVIKRLATDALENPGYQLACSEYPPLASSVFPTHGVQEKMALSQEKLSISTEETGVFYLAKNVFCS